MPSYPVTNRPSLPVPQGDRGDGMSAGLAHSGALQAAASLCTTHPAVVLCDLPGGVLGCVSPAPLHLAGPTTPTHVARLTQEQVSYDQCPHVSGTKRGSLNKAVPPPVTPGPRITGPCTVWQQAQPLSPGSSRLIWPLAWLDSGVLVSLGMGVVGYRAGRTASLHVLESISAFSKSTSFLLN